MERHLRWILPAPAVIAMALLLVVPLVYTAYLSLHEWYASSVLGPRFIWLDNYAQLFVRPALNVVEHRARCAALSQLAHVRDLTTTGKSPL